MKRPLTILAGVLVGLGVGIILVFGIFGVKFPFGGEENLGGSESPQNLAQDAPAPGFELTSLSGESLSLADYRGQIVILNFWATWCGPCALEMPALQERFEQYGDQLAIVAVNFDEQLATVQAFVDEFGLTFDVLLDPGAEVQHLYEVRGYPTSFFIDKDGTIRFIHVGLLTEEQLDGYLSQLGVAQ